MTLVCVSSNLTPGSTEQRSGEVLVSILKIEGVLAIGMEFDTTPAPPFLTPVTIGVARLSTSGNNKGIYV